MLFPVDIEGLFGQPVEVIVLVGEGDIVAAPNLDKAADKVVGIFVGEVGLVVYAAGGLAFIVIDVFLRNCAVDLFGCYAVVVIIGIFYVVAVAVGGFSQIAV